MSVWIMVIVMGSYRGSVATQEFTSKERCEVALMELGKLNNGAMTGVCVQK